MKMRNLLKVSGFVFVILFSLILTGCFGIRVTEPGFEIAGVEDGKTYEEPVTILITPEADTSITVTLNDKPFESGKPFGESGAHTLVV
jgi:hypothetical protein